ncbi:hypothetical protein GH714_010243 [Hevea brasiliensis]|uniref:Uncharacterized protein n=1 Tax=Hevea brasiliensis TaxID=3981 RepID=A0A6A6MY41_HEVBR|nr:hypothetical protein GH714_010243 [Hevea brasiliensis]
MSESLVELQRPANITPSLQNALVLEEIALVGKKQIPKTHLLVKNFANGLVLLVDQHDFDYPKLPKEELNSKLEALTRDIAQSSQAHTYEGSSHTRAQRGKGTTTLAGSENSGGSSVIPKFTKLDFPHFNGQDDPLVEYRAGRLNTVADALSRQDADAAVLMAISMPQLSIFDELRTEQQDSTEIQHHISLIHANKAADT